jgi:hypothetical protein
MPQLQTYDTRQRLEVPHLTAIARVDLFTPPQSAAEGAAPTSIGANSQATGTGLIDSSTFLEIS